MSRARAVRFRPMPPNAWLSAVPTHARPGSAVADLDVLRAEADGRTAALKAAAVARASSPFVARRPTDAAAPRHSARSHRLERLHAGDDAGCEPERTPINAGAEDDYAA